MVGVPGRSKGCNTCIKRKIKCDQEVPYCGNCRKSNRLCTGYKRRVGYVLSNDVSLVGPVEVGGGQTAVIHQGRWRKEKPELEKKQPRVTKNGLELPFLPIWLGGCDQSLGTQISLARQLREQFHALFLHAHLPEDMLAPGHPPMGGVGHWLVDLQDVVIETPELEAAVAAFCGSRIGRKNGDMNLVNRSLELYNQGVEGLRRALRDPRTRLSDQTLATCVALSLYEMAERRPGMKNAYAAHRQGAMMLLQLRGPDASASTLGHSLFLTIRAQEILGNIPTDDNKETFFSQHEWMTRPWKLSPKTALDQFLDMLFGFFAMNERLTEVTREENQTARLHGLHSMSESYVEMDTILDETYKTFEESISGPVYWPELSTIQTRVDDGELGKLFPVALHFPAFFVGQIVNTYWAAKMAVGGRLAYVWKMIAELEAGRGNAPGAAEAEQRASEHDLKWRDMAQRLCQSAEFFMQDKMGGLGRLVMVTFLRTCQAVYEDPSAEGSREMEWLREVMGKTLEQFNFPVTAIFGE